jgi:hypothetical protein
MTLALILIPALIVIAMLNTTSAGKVAYRMYIPCLMIVPVYFQQALGGFLLNATTLLVGILALAGIFRWYATLKFTWLDACVILYTFSAFYADFHVHAMNVAFYVLLQTMARCLLPYYIGRTLIEQTGMRRQFAMSLVMCLAIIGIISIWEFRMESNLFQVAVTKISHEDPGWGRQTRWGFGRIAGPYGHAILAGMIFSVGLLMQLWLVGTRSWHDSKLLRFVQSRRRPLAMTMAVGLGLMETQSRGPWIGCVFGLIIASIGFAKNRRRAATWAISGLVCAILVTSVVLDKYTAEKTEDVDQQNAEYRRNLYTTYSPLIAEGGMWGWGTPSIFAQGQMGWTKNQTSIDNEYIRIAMQQGYFGFWIFLLIFFFALIHLIRLCASLRGREDILFAYCMLGAVLAMAFTLTTVFLGDPMMQLAFLVFGWAQSLRPTSDANAAPAAVASSAYDFQRVFA